MIVGLGLLYFYFTLSQTDHISQAFYTCMHNFKTHFSQPLNHYSNRQTENPMAAVGLMCRLLSENVSSLLLP